MEFWGVEVKPGEPLKVTPEFGKLIHISQAALGEVKNVEGAKNVPLRLKISSKNFIIGSLSAGDRSQVMFDLVFEKTFELSHDWKDGSVYFLGYVADDPVSDSEGFSDGSDDESEEEEELVKAVENGKIKPKSEDVKAAKAAAKAGIKKEEESDSDEDDNDDSELPSDEEMALQQQDSGDDSEDDEDESSSDEELPKKVQQSKKRQAESAQVTPVPAKKAKAATPDKTGNKKGHTGTPFPSKAAGKGPAGNRSQGQNPRSGGHNKPFNKAQKSNGKGKHGGK